MKNIHLIATDKPSKLYLNGFQRLLLDAETESGDDSSFTNQHIYITSDEEIKDVRPHKGKWHLEGGNVLNKFPNYLTDLSECKLVILTTDQHLIKDGVQAIDDEFLEWFVKNPSCEEVEVKYELGSCLNCEWNHDMCPNTEECLKNTYKIIIPKEEPTEEEPTEEAKQTIYRGKDGELYFKPYGKEEKVKDYFSNDLEKVL